MDDAGIVELFIERDETAITELSLKYGARLKTIALRVLFDPLTAEECLNDAYLRIWELIPPAEPRDHLFPFAGRIVRGLAIDRVRAKSSLKRSAAVIELTAELSECLPSGDNAEETAEGNELKRAVNLFISGLPGERRTVFLKRYWYFEPVADIARSMGISESKVKTELHRMRQKLKLYLERKGWEI